MSKKTDQAWMCIKCGQTFRPVKKGIRHQELCQGIKKGFRVPSAKAAK